MSFCNTLQRKIVQLSALLTFIFGIGLFCYGLYIVGLILFSDYGGFFELDSNLGMFSQKYGALILGAFLLIIGSCGLLGSTSDGVKCKRAFLFIYQISLLILIAVFALIFYGLRFEAKKYFEQECDKTDLFKQLSDGDKSANDAFCAIPCPCNLDPTKFKDQSVLKGKIGFQNPKLPSHVQDCLVYDDEKYKYPSQLMELLEKDFSCSGWCKSTNIFVFSDVNRGNTDGTSCFNRFQEYYQKYVTVCGYIALGLALLFFLSFFFICGLYCYFSRKQKEKREKNELIFLLG